LALNDDYLAGTPKLGDIVQCEVSDLDAIWQCFVALGVLPPEHFAWVFTDMVGNDFTGQGVECRPTPLSGIHVTTSVSETGL
jgi:hypothetical protein